MASYPPSAAASVPAAGPFAASSTPVASSGVHPGTFAPGTKVQVGSHRVTVVRYLSEGGFAHVYVVALNPSSPKPELAVLKRVAVPDKEALASMRTEVETMKKLKGHKHIVTYIDSHASQLKAGGYEVFLLMEYCDGGGLIDFMNTRLKNRLTEPEILKIFSDTAEGVACMHYLKPPLLHRDLKVENVLISNTSSSKTYKLCDFGSSAPPRPAATSAAEGRLIEDDVQKHTTLQYRSPEMIDVYRKRPIDEKSDIWALGVLLYKLCYYTTPFEQQGQMAILTANFKYPPYPKFSDNLKLLIATMLTQDPQKRPNIYQVLCQVCAMRGEEVPIKDIYATRTHSEVRSHQRLPDPDPGAGSLTPIGASRAAPEQVQQVLPEITKMRRGRLAPSSQPAATSQQSKSKNDKDPFAALDSPSFATRSKAVDELSSRFPPAEQFSLLQGKSSTFQFGSSADPKLALNERVTNALADEAFAARPAAQQSAATKEANAAAAAKVASLRNDRNPDTPAIKSLQSPPIEKPTPQKPTMVSTGTMTSQPPSQAPSPKQLKVPSVKDRPIWRVPPPKPVSPSLDLAIRSNKQEPLISSSEPNAHRDSPASSRRSLEGERPSLLETPRTIYRSRSADETSLSPTKSDFPPADSSAPESPRRHGRREVSADDDDDDEADAHVMSNVEFLRAMEEEDASKSHHSRSGSRHKSKHASLPSMPKHMFGGKLGSAFRRFEAGVIGDHSHGVGVNERPSVENLTDAHAKDSFEDTAIDETEDLPPEMRRELERRRLSLEEKRVADAAAAYRQQLLNGAGPRAPVVNRASAIQNRVASLLDESGRVSPVKKTAKGYGKYTDDGRMNPSSNVSGSGGQYAANVDTPGTLGDGVEISPLGPSQPKTTGSQHLATRPVAPPKPKSLRQLGTTVSGTKPLPSQNNPEATVGTDVESDFTKRYPNLSLDQVEMEIQESYKAPSEFARSRVKEPI